MPRDWRKPPAADPIDGGERFLIRTPNVGFTGVRAGVRITAGVGYTVEDRRPAPATAAGGKREGVSGD